MNRSVVFFLVIASAVGTATAQSSVSGLTFNAPLGQVFYGQIASFKICSGQTITAIYAEVNWGDGTAVTGGEIPDPLFLGKLLGSHTYNSAQSFPIKIKLTATCFRDTGSSQFRWKDTATGTAMANVPLDIAVSSITVSPASILRGGTVAGTITMTASAPSWGSLVQLGSSDTAAATLPPGISVQATSNTATFTVTTKNFTGGARNVTITAVSGGVARSTTLRVR